MDKDLTEQDLDLKDKERLYPILHHCQGLSFFVDHHYGNLFYFSVLFCDSID